MYRIEYALKSDGDGVHVSSYDVSAAPTAKTALPIIMISVNCHREGSFVDISEVAKLVDSAKANDDFVKNFSSILHGLSQSWRLVDLNFASAGSITFSYYQPQTDTVQELYINVDDAKITSLELQLEVPHIDCRPPTEYRITMQINSVQESSTIIEVSVVDSRKLFLLDSRKPSAIFVTEYADL